MLPSEYQTNSGVSRLETRSQRRVDVSVPETQNKIYVISREPLSMTGDTSQGDTSPERTGGAPATLTGSDAGRVFTWLSRNGIYIEAGLSVIAIAVGVVAIPFLAFGSLAAIGGEGSILAGGAVIGLTCVVLLIGLATLLLVHSYVEVRQHGFPFTGGDGVRAIAYGGIRTVETIVAAAFLGGLLTAVGLAISVGQIPTPLTFSVVAAAVGLPTAVLARTAGRFASTVLDTA